MQGIQDPSSQNLSQLLGQPQVRFIVPKFQRDYSWDAEHWADLWQDIQSVIETKGSEHYMGYLVLQMNDKNSIAIIDGQQRITTLSIIILAIIKRLQELQEANQEVEKNQKRERQLKDTYIGQIDIETTLLENKLILNRNNDQFYSNFLVALRRPANRKIRASDKRLWDCFEWMYARLESYKTGLELVKLSNIITTKLYFSILRVSEDVNAFKVFETLNARGVELSSADLLKNYLFQLADNGTDSHIQEMDDYWNSIATKLKTKEIVEFIRVYWNSRNKLARKNNLFREIRSSVITKKDAFIFVKSLYELCDVYNELIDPSKEFWEGNKNILDGLTSLKIFKKKLPIPFLLVAYEKLFEDRKNVFLQILKSCVTASFRRNVISNLNPNEEEEFYNRLAVQLYNSSSFDINSFKEIYVGDEAFKEAFLRKDFKTEASKICKYILATIEDQAIDINSTVVTIEHIIPQGDKSEWEISEEDAEYCVYKLGNMTLLENKKQKAAANHSFNIKSAVYKNSNFAETREIGQLQEWGPKEVERRQSKLASKAAGIWSIQFQN